MLQPTGLVVEDDQVLGPLLLKIMTSSGFKTTLARTQEQAFTQLSEASPECVLLDLSLPDGSGMEVVQYLFSESYATKCLVVASSTLPRVKDSLWRWGVLDIIQKPCSLTEVQHKLLNWKAYHKTLPLTSFEKNEHLHLSDAPDLLSEYDRFRPQEYRVFQCLLQHKNRVVSKEQIIQYVWGTQEPPQEKTIEVYIKRIRSKLPESKKIATKRGFGYVLCDSGS